MAKCTECKYEGKYSVLPVPFPIEMMMGMKLGMPGKVNVALLGFEEEARKYGFTKDDLSKKGMHCQAAGGGPTKDPIVLIQAMADQPCSFYAPKSMSTKSIVASKAGNPTTSKKKSIFTKVSAKQLFIASLILLVLAVVVPFYILDFRPSAQADAISPGLIFSVLGWGAIICVIAGIVKSFLSRKK